MEAKLPRFGEVGGEIKIIDGIVTLIVSLVLAIPTFVLLYFVLELLT